MRSRQLRVNKVKLYDVDVVDGADDGDAFVVDDDDNDADDNVAAVDDACYCSLYWQLYIVTVVDIVVVAVVVVVVVVRYDRYVKVLVLLLALLHDDDVGNDVAAVVDDVAADRDWFVLSGLSLLANKLFVCNLLLPAYRNVADDVVQL